MDIDLPTLTAILSQPIEAVQIALPLSLEGKWPFPTRIRTNFVAIRTEAGTLFLHYGFTEDSLLDGLIEDNPAEGHVCAGSLNFFEDDDMLIDAISETYPFQSPEPLEMIDLTALFPDAGRIHVPGETACEVAFTQTIRDGEFRFDVSGIRIYSSEASTVMERGAGGVLECSVQS